MQTYTVGEFKAKLSEILEKVSRGESVILQKGRNRKTVAVLSPFPSPHHRSRKLGSLSKRGKVTFKDWEMSDDEFLASR